MSAAVETPLTVTCTVCERSCPVTPEFATRQRAKAAADGDEITGEQIAWLAALESDWVLWDDTPDENEELTCPECVEATKAERAKRTCPPWCQTDHAAEEIAREWTFQHLAPPDSEMVNVGRWNAGPMYVEVVASSLREIKTDDDAEEVAEWLHQVADEVTLAAAWLEGLR